MGEIDLLSSHDLTMHMVTGTIGVGSFSVIKGTYRIAIDFDI